jgi:L-rhamnose mutarotase
MKRVAQMIQLKSEGTEGCEEIKSIEKEQIWPEIEKTIRDVARIRDYSIFQQGCILFAYFEYEGPEDDFEARMERLWNAPRMQEWLAEMGLPLDTQAEGAWWIDMRTVFHQD